MPLAALRSTSEEMTVRVPPFTLPDKQNDEEDHNFLLSSEEVYRLAVHLVAACNVQAAAGIWRAWVPKGIVSGRAEDPSPPLVLAARRGSDGAAALLLALGADLSRVDSAGVSCIDMVARKGYDALLEQFLGAPGDALPGLGGALARAAEQGHRRCVALLLNCMLHDAPSEMQHAVVEDACRAAAFAAAAAGREATLADLLERCSLDTLCRHDINGRSLLGIATRRRHAGCVGLLLRMGGQRQVFEIESDGRSVIEIGVASALAALLEKASGGEHADEAIALMLFDGATVALTAGNIPHAALLSMKRAISAVAAVRAQGTLASDALLAAAAHRAAEAVANGAFCEDDAAS